MIASAEKIPRGLRHLAGEILCKVDCKKAYADVLLDQTLNTHSLGARDRALLTEIVYGTLRWRGAIDARLSRHLRRPLCQSDAWIRNLLRLTAYQLDYLDRVPDYAAVNEAVNLAKQHGGRKTAAFVNGVLRSFLRGGDPPSVEGEPSTAALATECSHPEWLVQRWTDAFGRDEAQKLMRANNEPAPLTLRANALRCSPDQLLERLSNARLSAEATRWSPQGVSLRSAGDIRKIPGFADGWFQIQGEASQLMAYLLGPLPGERILDACAAPGGKSTHIAEIMKDQGEVVAIDHSAPGIAKIHENLSRLGLRSVCPLLADACGKLNEAADGVYDRILLDAPCTGLGTLRAHPEIKWQRSENDIRRLRDLQTRLLDNVSGYLRSGGVLVYSTCTLTSEENERNVESFLARHPGFELQEAVSFLPQRARKLVRGAYFTTLPQLHRTDGFFAARMRKV